MTAMHREAFLAYLNEENKEGSGRAVSYVRGLDLLGDMIRAVPMGFEDCAEIWSVSDVGRLQALLERVREEQKKGDASAWNLEDVAPSYLQKGYCKAALGQYRYFLTAHRHHERIMELFRNHQGDPDELAELLNREAELPDFLEREMEGKEAIRETKVRINQGGFRKMILEIYENRCCVTGLDLPQLCIASHIIPWADRKDTRMDPRNGLCLSATYDKAFDNHLITFDEDYRLVVSRDIREHYRNDHIRELFEKREGQVIWMPKNADKRPLQTYLYQHRNNF